MQVKTHKFNNVKYDIDIDCIDGFCENPIKKKRIKDRPVIFLVDGLPYGNDKRAKTGLRVLIHEALHACFWDITEDKVNRISTDISSLLWRLGYRRKRE